MFESKLNRGRAGGYAPLDGTGKVPLDKLPPIQSTIDTGSFVKNNQTGSFLTSDQTSSFVTFDQTGSFVTFDQTGSFLTSLDGAITSSEQLTVEFDERYTISGSISQPTWSTLEGIPSGIVSSSQQIFDLGFITSSLELANSNLTFIGNTIEGNNVNAAGTKVEVATSKDNTVDLNGNGVYIAYNSTNNQVQVGWIVRFYDGTVRTINSKLFIDGYLAFGVEGNVELYPAYPLTIESPDYNVGDDPYLDFKVGDNIITLDSGSNLIGVNNLTTTTSFNSFTSSIQNNVNALTAQTSSYLTSNSISNLLSKTTGSWTITPGTANYSFTLDTNSTYQMWVLGNIPNGIISYNATVTISNANVPVLGTQSAWNYIEGGSPILLTTLPRQIVGVDGTISTSNPGGLGVNTNIFSFEIQNNTTGSVVVNYGYTKIS
jgi:hypothetical protein